LSPKTKGPEERIEIPRWIVTFTDMTTNLLTFFVLLLSLGHIRDDTLFDEGNRISCYFLQSVKAGFGFRDATLFEHASIRHLVEQPQQCEGVTRDAQEQRTRQLFDLLQRSLETRASPLAADRVNFSIANVRFAPGETTLEAAGRQWLSRFGMDLQQSHDPATTVLYVVAVAGPEATDAGTWHLTAQRAWAVADCLRQSLWAPPGEARADGPDPWRVFWWGAGPGGAWAGQDHLAPGQSQILLAVARRDP